MKYHHKESGLTLIEILAVTIIASLMLLTIYSIISQSSNSFQKQTTTNKEINDAAYALKVITKEVRKNPSNVSIVSSTELTINGEKIFFDRGQRVIKQGINILSTDIEDFKVSPTKLKDSTTPSQSINNPTVISVLITNAEGKEFSAELYLRKRGTY
ncbi:PilW family protein [Lysinibacillus sp. NPDC047702]|uniref:PilW family protein n=1 Tax=unclassified Lysinibacillus TaxID=2636778 RepID=UPI003D024A40